MTKGLKRSLNGFFALVFILTLMPMCVSGHEYTVSEVESLADGILAYKLSQNGADSVQDWIDGALADGAGTSSEWYIMALSQQGYTDLANYENSLLDYISTHNKLSATTQQKLALALCAAGSHDSYIDDTVSETVGQQGIMSLIYGLHIMNNGYGSSERRSEVIDELLSLQYDDGGWALFGGVGDTDVTSMTIQALAPEYPYDLSVQAAVEDALAFLSDRQQENGGYSSFGDENPESAAQVVTALSALGIDCETDERFIKDGNTVMDSMERFALGDGSYSHFADGDMNETATVQVYYSYVAYMRMDEGKSPLYVFDNRASDDDEPEQQEVPGTEPAAQTEPAAENHNDTPAVTDPPAETTPAQTDAPKETTVKAATAAASTTSKTSGTSTVSSSSASTSLTSRTKASSSGSTVKTSASSETSTTVTAAVTFKADQQSRSGGSYKGKAVAVVLIAAVILSLIIFAAGRRNYKNFIAVGIAAAIAIAVILMTDIRSAEDYYSGEVPEKSGAIGTVTMTIRCDTIVGKSDSEYIPEDGCILDVTDFQIEEGDTVFDVLSEAAQTYGLQVENTGSSGSAHGLVYIAGINYIYEMDFGDLSGWVYHVNGITPSRNCGEYVLSDGDAIEWLYTTELGHDLNEVYEDEAIQ